jgi:hypothetical protein
MNEERGGGSRLLLYPFYNVFPQPNNPHFSDLKTEIVIVKKISKIKIHFGDVIGFADWQIKGSCQKGVRFLSSPHSV